MLIMECVGTSINGSGNAVQMIIFVMVVDIIMNVLEWKELENYTTENGLWAQSIVKWIVLYKNKSGETYQDRQVALILTNVSMDNAAFEIGIILDRSVVLKSDREPFWNVAWLFPLVYKPELVGDVWKFLLGTTFLLRDRKEIGFRNCSWESLMWGW